MTAKGNKSKGNKLKDKPMELSNNAEYLKEQLGRVLALSLAEIAWKRPADPVHYLAHKLYNSRKIEQMQAQKITDKNLLESEKEHLMSTDEMKIQTFGLIPRPSEEIKPIEQPKEDIPVDSEEEILGDNEDEIKQLERGFEDFVDSDIDNTDEED